jgi:hypothetical protein
MKNPISFLPLATLFLFSLFLNPKIAQAQAPIPPLPMELMFGHERLDYQLVMKRNFTATSKFSE